MGSCVDVLGKVTRANGKGLVMFASKNFNRFALAVVLAAGFAVLPSIEVLADSGKPFVYPKAHKGDVVDDFHGTKVPDPYRWMEDSDSPQRRKWIEAENRITFGYLGEIPERARIKERLTHLWDYEKYRMPYKHGGRYF